MNENLRIFFFGDSFVQGIGDPEYRGWVGRVVAETGTGITAFNLGIRRNTSDDVLRRGWTEIEPRLAPDADHRLVVSFGSNDAVEENGVVRVDPDRCLDNLATIVDGARQRAIAPLIVGPPPVIDAGEPHLRRTTALAERMAALCHTHDVPFIATTTTLAEDAIWRAEALAGDGAHPSSGGYRRLAEIVLADRWHDWIAQPRR
ncbi:GDSL-type esterase/lipase family protein [Nocardia rhizosphaerihabitans]|uniref:GDSL-type esterase/lipase family protein n=1 Tax=Nocardia rhizosphaerihabitans TaxID=1691570 RepID=UPI003670EA21